MTGDCELWDAYTGQCLATLARSSQELVRSLQSLIAAHCEGSEDQNVRLWDTGQPKLVQALRMGLIRSLSVLTVLIARQ